MEEKELIAFISANDLRHLLPAQTFLFGVAETLFLVTICNSILLRWPIAGHPKRNPIKFIFLWSYVFANFETLERLCYKGGSGRLDEIKKEIKLGEIQNMFVIKLSWMGSIVPFENLLNFFFFDVLV